MVHLVHSYQAILAKRVACFSTASFSPNIDLQLMSLSSQNAQDTKFHWYPQESGHCTPQDKTSHQFSISATTLFALIDLSEGRRWNTDSLMSLIVPGYTGPVPDRTNITPENSTHPAGTSVISS